MQHNPYGSLPGIENGVPVSAHDASGQQVAATLQNQATGYIRQPESLPAFPSLVGALDTYMQRIPWWVITLAAILGYRWLTKGR